MDRQQRRGTALSRRHFLSGLLGTAGVALLAACGAETPPPTAGSTTTAAGSAAPSAAPATTATTTPAAAATTRPATATTAAPASTATRAATAGSGTPTGNIIVGPGGGRMLRSQYAGVPDLWLEAGKPFKSVTATPGRGGRVTSLHITAGNAPIVAHDQNAFWLELEKQMGVRLEPNIVPSGSYQEKLAALTAGGDIPDISLIALANAPEQYKALQQGAYTDLTQYIGGAARKDYPNMALIPDAYWQGATLKGKLYGVPRPTTFVSQTLVYRQDWADKFKVARPKEAEEFFQVMVSMTKNDPDGNGQPDSWGLGANGGNWDMPFFQSIFRVPNTWRKNADGTLTAALETDEYRAAVAYAQRLFAAGAFHPDSATMNTTQAKTAFSGGKIGAYTDGTGGVVDFRPRGRFALPDSANAIGLVPFGHDGGKAVTSNGSGLIGFVAIPAKVSKDTERVKELLRICDYLCAPYGSEEKNFFDYGIEGVHHTVNADGIRVTNDKLASERGDLVNICKAPLVTTNFLLPDEARRTFAMNEGLHALAIDNPVQNSYSQTAVSKIAELTQLERDRIGSIIQGREPLSALDTMIKDWRSRGGDQIRKEYEAELKA